MTQSAQQDLVLLWWVADDQVELDRWRVEFAEIGAEIMKLSSEAGSQRIHVVVRMPRAVAVTKYKCGEWDFLEE
jgi:hypothetical protein